MEEKQLMVTMDRIQDYQFNVRFDGAGELLMDEPEPLGAGRGPSASMVLSAAVGNCLSASALFCLRKARVEPESVSTSVRTSFARNEKGRLRIKDMQVQIELKVTDEDRSRITRCLELFEDFCVVTESVRHGIDVRVEVPGFKSFKL